MQGEVYETGDHAARKKQYRPEILLRYMRSFEDFCHELRPDSRAVKPLASLLRGAPI